MKGLSHRDIYRVNITRKGSIILNSKKSLAVDHHNEIIMEFITK